MRKQIIIIFGNKWYEMKRKGKPMKHFAKETKKMLAFLVAITLMFGCVQTNGLFANATGLADNSFVSEMELGGDSLR